MMIEHDPLFFAFHGAWLAAAGDKSLRVDYDLGSDSVVLDVGGYRGDWAQAIHDRYGCRIHICEPIPELAERIRRRFAGNPEIAVHEFGLGPRNERVPISWEADASSVFKTSEHDIEVRMVDVSDFLADQKLVSLDLAKINIEGGEYPLLQALLDRGLVGKFRNIQVQFHDFVENAAARKSALAARLKGSHFLTYKFDFVWENWERRPDQSEDPRRTLAHAQSLLERSIELDERFAAHTAQVQHELGSKVAELTAERDRLAFKLHHIQENLTHIPFLKRIKFILRLSLGKGL